MSYIVFITINTKARINNKNRIYVGWHKIESEDIFDGYLGDGVYINQPSSYMYPKTAFQCAVKKYGAESFRRITLFVSNSKEQVEQRYESIVDDKFINQDFTYNVYSYKIDPNVPIYQFDLNGNLKKKWDSLIGPHVFYNLSIVGFNYAIWDKHILMNTLWSNSSTINVNEYNTKSSGKLRIIHLYTSGGKWLREFESVEACAHYLGVEEQQVYDSTYNERPINGYYVSCSITDEFKPRARRQQFKQTYYIYKQPYEFLGKFEGKEIMKVINLHSWAKIRNIFTVNHNWYKDFYITSTPIDIIPDRVQKQYIDIYDKYGKFIETMYSLKDIKIKYKIPSARLKDIQKGNKFFGEYIFKYRNNK